MGRIWHYYHRGYLNENKNMKKRDEEEIAESDFSPRTLVHREGNVIYFFDEVDGAAVCDAIRYIDTLEYALQVENIIFKLNSGGGSVYDGLALYDRLRNCKCHITMIGSGLIASMAFIIYLAGDQRICTPNVRFLNHQTKAGLAGDMTGAQIKIEEKETTKIENMCVDICAERTFLTPKIVRNHIKLGDKYISATEAISMGIAHEIQAEAQKETEKNETPSPEDRKKDS
jgi:ATP-dependent protease ClpP protease subunit